MNYQKAFFLAAVAVATLPSSGCSLLGRFHQSGPETNAPVVFSAQPSVDEVIAAVNTNTSGVRALQASSATLHPTGLPPLQADLVFERPRRFRLQAAFSRLLGQEVDMGSNNELFWVYIRRGTPPAMYYAHHDQFASSALGRSFPVQPQWIVEALGLVELSPADQHHELAPLSADRFELNFMRNGQRRRLVIHSRYGWILEQHVYGPSGEPIASAVASAHRYYPHAQVSLPHHVNIQLGPSGVSRLELDLDVASYSVNQIQGDPAYLWNLPTIPDVGLVDLSAQQPQTASTTAPDARHAPYQRTSGVPRYRGDALLR